MSTSDPGAPLGSAIEDARAYVPRRASEDALAELASYLRVGATRVVLRGPSGIGISMLLHVVEARLAQRLRIVRLGEPFPPAEQLSARILEQLDEPEDGTPELLLVSLARDLRERGSGLTILVDDADSMPLPTIRRLSRLAGEARPAISLVLALGDGAPAESALAALDAPIESISLREPMTLEETRVLIEARLAGLSECERGLFEDDTIGAIHRDSAGVPGAVVRGLRARIDAREEPETVAAPIEVREEAEATTPAEAWVETPIEAESETPVEVGVETQPIADPTLEDVKSEPLDPAEMARVPRRFWGVALAAAAAAAALLAFLLLRGHEPAPDLAGTGAPQGPMVASAPSATGAFPDTDPGATGHSRTGEAVQLPERESEPVVIREATTRAEPPAAPLAVAAKRPAKIRVAINAVPWARIEVDGRDAGVTPLADILLSAGPHRFRATLPDGQVVLREEEISRFNRRVLFRAERPEGDRSGAQERPQADEDESQPGDPGEQALVEVLGEEGAGQHGQRGSDDQGR